MNGTEVVAALDRGDLDAALESILLAAYRRKGSARYNPAAPTAGLLASPSKAFRVGSRVVFNRLVSPKYMIGLTGTVTKVNGATVKVELDAESKALAGRFSSSVKPIGCPKSIVDVV